MPLLRAGFEIEPVGRKGGWTIQEDGQPRVWWKARLTHVAPIRLSDGTDAREHEVTVSIYVGKETPLGQVLYKGEPAPSPKFGFISRSENADIWVRLWLSEANVDRIFRSLQSAPPPLISVGFGPEGLATKLAGPITWADNREGYKDCSDEYRWNDAAKDGFIVVEAVEFTSALSTTDEEAPSPPESPPAFMRAMSIAWTILVNLAAVAIAYGALKTAHGRFETAAISILLLIYVLIVSTIRGISPALLQLEAASVSRFTQLRALIGQPMTSDERKYFAAVRKVDEDRLVHRLWIGHASSICIGALAVWKLFALLL